MPFRSGKKKCPMCNTLNDPSAQSCTYCGYIFEDTLLQPSNTTKVSAPAQQQLQPQDKTPQSTFQPQTASASASVPSTSSSSMPVFVISNSLRDRRSLSSLIISFIFGAFILLLYTGLGIFTILIALFFFAPPIISIIRTVYFGKTYEFGENSLVIKERRGFDQEIPYTDVTSIVNLVKRGQSVGIYLALKDKRRVLRIQGIAKSSDPNLTDYYSWLEKKIPKTKSETGEEETEQHDDEYSDQESESSSSLPSG